MFEHWTANGWKNGAAASKDWKAGMRKWNLNRWFPSQRANLFSGNGRKPETPGIKPDGTLVARNGECETDVNINDIREI